jgi:gamma-glutamyltranspeptidase
MPTFVLIALMATALAIEGNKSAKDLYLLDGLAPKVGQMFRNRDLAASLRLIAAHGRDGFYKGANSQALIREAKAGGVEWTARSSPGPSAARTRSRRTIIRLRSAIT